MFINPSKFAPALKRAYQQQGFAILRTDETLAIDARTWFVEFRLEHLPKEIHAELVKTVGWLPMVDEAYEYAAGSAEQLTMPDAVTRAKDLMQREGNLTAIYETPIVLKIAGDGEWRLMQTKSGRMAAAQEYLLTLPDWKKTDPGEAVPVPYLYDGRIVWANDRATFVINAYREEEGKAEQVTAALEMTGADLTCESWPGARKWVRL